MSVNLYKVYKTTLNMLYNRGYDVPLDTEGPESRVIVMPFDKFSAIEKDNLTIIMSLRPDCKINRFPKIIVFFPDDNEKLGVRLIRAYYEKMVSLNINKAILIVKENITSFAKNEILSYINTVEPEKSIYIETFLESSLIFDPTTHELVPKHELLSEEEKKKFLGDYKIKEIQLGKILISDPIVRYYDFKEKDVIKITRPSETGGVYYNYRVVI